MWLNIEKSDVYITCAKRIFILLYTYYVFYKITNNKFKLEIKYFFSIINVILLAIFATVIKYNVNNFISLFISIFLLSIICSYITKNKIGYVLVDIIIAIGINYIIFFIDIVATFFINLIYTINNDYINFLMMIIIHTAIVRICVHIKRIKNGISYLNNREENTYFDILALNISLIIVISFIFFSNMDSKNEISKNIFFIFFVVSIIMFLTIKKSIEAYYKQKLLIQDLNETKKELEEKKKEIEELESENLNFSKKSHSLAHKQKSLEFKINKLLMNSENAKELRLEDDLKNISKELYENSKLPQLEKTGITEIDDMLSVMQEECRINGIDFSLQLKGNIYQMTNNFVTKEELSILLADHIKDAIIAIKHTDNINKSIMVRLGKIDENFGLYIYDSGIEFPKEVLENLGKKPITTYSDEGGTGMGFMNTFDTLKKHNASLIIESIGKPSKDNYTKVIKIIFDNKCQKTYK